jgi:hypothetical protein
MTTALAGATPDFDRTAPLRTDDDVLRRVDLLLADTVRQLRSVVLLFLDDDGVQLPVVVPVDDVPERPDPMLVGSMCWVIAEVLRQYPGGSAIVALTRPGVPQPDNSDLDWCEMLRAAARQQHSPVRMFCLATPSGVRTLTDGT